jgi:hypothetical protein
MGVLLYFVYSHIEDPQVCIAIKEVANRLVGKDAEALFADMGKTWDYMMADPQLRWFVLSLRTLRLTVL